MKPLQQNLPRAHRWSHRLIGATVSAVLVTACGRDPAPHIAAVGRTFDVPIVELRSRTIPLIYTATGTVVSDERVEISSRTTAYVRSLEVREGERVRQRQLLAHLDSQDLDARIRAATAARDQTRAAQADADRDVKDSATLLSRGLVAQAHQRKAQLALDAATESSRMAEAALSQALAERQYTRILSPVAGVVVARHRRTGDLITPGTPLLTVESDTALLFQTEVPEQRVAGIAVGDAVPVQVDALKQIFGGEVVRRVASGDPLTRGFEVKVALPAASGLLPGMFGRAAFGVGQRQALVVPAASLVERGGLTGVFVVDPQRTLRFRWVRTGQSVENGVVVEAGLDAGERIATQVPSTMRDGDALAPAKDHG